MFNARFYIRVRRFDDLAFIMPAEPDMSFAHDGIRPTALGKAHDSVLSDADGQRELVGSARCCSEDSNPHLPRRRNILLRVASAAIVGIVRTFDLKLLQMGRESRPIRSVFVTHPEHRNSQAERVRQFHRHGA